MSAEEERGRELVARAIRWIGAHPESWRELLSMCRWAQRKYGHVSRDVVYTECMRRRVDVTERPDICREHDLWSALVRLASRSTPGGLDFKRDPRCTVDKAYPTPEDLPEIPEEAVV